MLCMRLKERKPRIKRKWERACHKQGQTGHFDIYLIQLATARSNQFFLPSIHSQSPIFRLHQLNSNIHKDGNWWKRSWCLNKDKSGFSTFILYKRNIKCQSIEKTNLRSHPPSRIELDWSLWRTISVRFLMYFNNWLTPRFLATNGGQFIRRCHIGADSPPKKNAQGDSSIYKMIHWEEKNQYINQK